MSCGKRHELRHFRVKGNSRKAYLSNSCDACISERQSKVRAARRKGEELPAIGEGMTIALIQEMCAINRRVTRMRFDGRLREAQPLLAKVAELRYALCIDTDTVNGATRSQVLAGWTGLDGLGAAIQAEQ